jgi:uncharacterized alkaline shock family protein YloU
MSENNMHGQIQIADEVVGVIAVTAALEVEGVVSGSHHGKGITEFFGKKGHTKCVKVAKDENEAVVDMEIIVKFGTKVQKIAYIIKQACKVYSIYTEREVEVVITYDCETSDAYKDMKADIALQRDTA